MILYFRFLALTLALSHRERELPLLWERVGVRIN